MNNVSLYSVTPDTGGIFSALDSFTVPWKDTVNAELIDLQYYGNVSGEKIISPLVYKNLSEGKLTTTKQALIASMIFSMFGTNWTKEWNTLSMQYDPIANYDMTETMTDDETVTEYGKTHTKTGTETDAPNLTVSTSDTVHGFNSSNAVPTDARSQGTSGSDIKTYDTSDADTGEDTQTRNYELTRKGNIGVTSSQQLLESERNLWMWNYFLDVVFPDVDKILTIPIYADPEEYTENGFVPTGTISIIENGLQIDVKQYAFADVEVPNTYTVDDQGKVVYGDLLIGQTSRTITENGEYDTTLNNDCTVNVPNTYTLSDEGKVVSSGELVAQTSRTITENGEYDTTTNNSVSVSVSGNTILSGDSIPDNSQGNDGDLYLKYGNDTRAANFTPDTNSYSATVGGWKFSVSKNIKITGLSVYPRGTITNVYLTNENGVNIASLTNKTVIASQWNDLYFDTPIILQPGIYIVYYDTENVNCKHTANLITPIAVSYISGVYSTTHNTFPSQTDPGIAYGCNIVIDDFIETVYYKKSTWKTINYAYIYDVL